ncbi:MAG: P-II family nitrogen regulator [Gemmataceae bacterium]
MTQLVIVVKPFRAEAVLRVVAGFGAAACVVREAKGYGRQKGYLDRYKGGEFSRAYLPKVEITVWVPADRADELADAVARAAPDRADRGRQGVRRPVGVAGHRVLTRQCSVDALSFTGEPGGGPLFRSCPGSNGADAPARQDVNRAARPLTPPA